MTGRSNVDRFERSEALNPDLARLLELVHLDRIWKRGDGVWLYDSDGRKFLDFYSQYGAVALGHNDPKLCVQSVMRSRRAARPWCNPIARPTQWRSRGN